MLVERMLSPNDTTIPRQLYHPLAFIDLCTRNASSQLSASAYGLERSTLLPVRCIQPCQTVCSLLSCFYVIMCSTCSQQCTPSFPIISSDSHKHPALTKRSTI
ncbi:hypothetical protein Ancab_030447 [Ancistrocladus abbreviatus]